MTAASDWGAQVERKVVRPARPESYEALFHECGGRNFFLDLSGSTEGTSALDEPRPERAIG